MLDVLRRIIQEVNAAEDLQSALEIIVDRVKLHLHTHVCSVYLYDDERQRYVFMATRGLNEAAVGRVSIGHDEGLVGLVGQRAEPINLEEAPAHPRYHFVSEIGEEPFRSFLGVPIIHHRKVLGVLVVQQREARRYDEEEEALLITLSAQLAGVIAHAGASGVLRRIVDDPADMPAARFVGKGVAGVAIGTAVVMSPGVELETVPMRPARDIEVEVTLFRAAVDAVKLEILGFGAQLEGQLQAEEMALFDAYQHMLDETALSGEIIALIEAGQWAQGALRQVILAHVRTFESMHDSYLRERAADIRDLGQRVLAKLQSDTEPRLDFPEDSILVARTLAPSMLAEAKDKVVGLISVEGSSNSHVAILAEAMGIPAVMGAEDLPVSLIEDCPVIVDGFQGIVITHPNQEQLAYYGKVVAEEAALLAELVADKDEPAETRDGYRIRLWVNTGLVADVLRSLDRGAEGVGLYRTEVYFMMNDRFPTEEEQRLIYREHLLAFSPRPVTMRTLDIGGDKPLSYFPIDEPNPFLGWRGIRVTLDHPEIFLSQVRAMIRANEGIDAELRIMLPMVSSVAEVDEAQRLISQCYREIVEEGVEVEMPDVGVMIEVPAAVYQAEEIIKRVDFLSVGSNDLIQYMLAVDRNNSRVAELYQPFHPAVLRALRQVVKAAHKEKKAIAICGEMAAIPSSAVLLIAMGYDMLSMNSPNLLIIKAIVRAISMRQAQKILARVLKMENAYLIKNYVDDELRGAGLGHLLRGPTP